MKCSSYVFLACYFFTGVTQGDDINDLWVQEWGLSSVSGPVDFDVTTNQLLTVHHGAVMLWDAKTGLALRQYTGSKSVFAVRFYRDDQILVHARKGILVYERQTGKLVQKQDLEVVNKNHYLLSPDAQKILIATCGRESIRLWDFESKETVQTFASEGRVTSAAISPDQRFLLTGAQDGVAILWDIQEGKIHQRFRSPVGITKVVFSADAKRCLTIGAGEFWYSPRVLVWDVQTATPQLLIPRTVQDAYFIQEGIRIIYPDGTEEDWSYERVESAPDKKDWPTKTKPHSLWVSIAPNNWRLIVDRNMETAKLIKPDTQGQQIQIPNVSAMTDANHHYPIAFSLSGRFMLSGATRYGHDSNCVAVWDLEKAVLKFRMDGFYSGAISPDETQAAIYSRNELKLIEIESGKVLQEYRVPTGKSYSGGSITSVQFSGSGQQLLLSFGDWYDGDCGAVLLLDCSSGEVLCEHDESSKAILIARFGSSHQQVVAARSPGNDGSSGINELQVIDAESGEILKSKIFDVWWGIEVEDVEPSRKSIPVTTYEERKQTVGRFPFLSLFHSETLELAAAKFRGEFLCWGPSGNFFCSSPRIGLFEFRSTKENDVLCCRSSSLDFKRAVRLHPRGFRLAGVRAIPGKAMKKRSAALCLENIFSGEIDAQFYLFPNEDGWLITTASGAVNGSEAGLSRITKRTAGTVQLKADHEWARSLVDTASVSNVISQSLPDEGELTAKLRELPKEELPDDPPFQPDPPRWYDFSMEKRERIARELEAAGADLKIDIHKSIHFVHLEKKNVTTKLLKDLRWAGGVDRLYLAKTGITDDQLDYVGVLSQVKRLSLWENPISDRGIAELTSLWKLEVLDIHDTDVSAEGVLLLKSLPNLKTLILPKRIQPEELQEFRKTRPKINLIIR